MEFKTNQIELNKAINIVQRAVAVKSNVPYLTGILLEAKDNKLYLTGNDLQKGIEVYIKADVKEEGAVVISSKLFGEFIRKLPNEEINFKTENNKLNISCLDIKLNIIYIDKNDYPKIVDINKDNFITINKNLLDSMIRKTIFAASKDEERPIIMGLNFKIKDNELSMVALDGFRVSIKKCEINVNKNIDIIIPATTLLDIQKIINNIEEEEIFIYISDNKIMFIIENIKIISSLIDGEYFDYKKMIDNKYNTKIEINNKQLLDAIDRVSLLSNKNKAIKLNIKDNKLIIDSTVEIGYAKEELIVNKEGEDLEIGFNPNFLMDVFKLIDTNNINIYFKSAISPCIIKEKNNEDFIYILLPIRIRKEK